MIGYHQKCHETKILQRALEDDSVWICYFCEQEMACPYVTNADVLTQSLEDFDDQGSKSNTLKPKKVSILSSYNYEMWYNTFRENKV